MKLIILYISAFLIMSCAHKPGPQIVPESDLGSVFANGLYKQDIAVTYLNKEGKKESHTFNGILKKSSSEIYLYCYVGFGISLFKLKDNFKDPVSFVASEARIEKNKEFFLKMYPIIKEILLLQKSDSRLKDGRMTIDMQPENFPVTIQIASEKLGPVPKMIVFENAEHFRFEIVNTEFDIPTKP